MTGPEHYREAERLLDSVRDGRGDDRLLAFAQIHASLAQTAVLADAYFGYFGPDPTPTAWLEILS